MGAGERPVRPESALAKQHREWLAKRPPGEAHGITCKQFAQQAMDKGLWIFDTGVKRWYSPEEFLDTWERLTCGHEQYLKKMEFRDPEEGLKAGYQQLKNLSERLESFSKRVYAYYKNKAAKPR